ncbi:MAG: hypothetical protein KIT84_00310 [Labilithrix sp.]|nr:hypothetical protein [Labilithrix sp.]MCW5809425.1 hypothetical protein [Labilithrix sp.]
MSSKYKFAALVFVMISVPVLVHGSDREPVPLQSRAPRPFPSTLGRVCHDRGVLKFTKFELAANPPEITVGEEGTVAIVLSWEDRRENAGTTPCGFPSGKLVVESKTGTSEHEQTALFEWGPDYRVRTHSLSLKLKPEMFKMGAILTVRIEPTSLSVKSGGAGSGPPRTDPFKLPKLSPTPVPERPTTQRYESKLM